MSDHRGHGHHSRGYSGGGDERSYSGSYSSSTTGSRSGSSRQGAQEIHDPVNESRYVYDEQQEQGGSNIRNRHDYGGRSSPPGRRDQRSPDGRGEQKRSADPGTRGDYSYSQSRTNPNSSSIMTSSGLTNDDWPFEPKKVEGGGSVPGSGSISRSFWDEQVRSGGETLDPRSVRGQYKSSSRDALQESHSSGGSGSSRLRARERSRSRSRSRSRERSSRGGDEYGDKYGDRSSRRRSSSRERPRRERSRWSPEGGNAKGSSSVEVPCSATKSTSQRPEFGSSNYKSTSGSLVPPPGVGGISMKLSSPLASNPRGPAAVSTLITRSPFSAAAKVPSSRVVIPGAVRRFQVASVFAEDDEDEEPEEMPPECKMRMKNVGRETPTSAGPNSFGKTKIGFCNVIHITEKEIQTKIANKDGGTGVQQPRKK